MGVGGLKPWGGGGAREGGGYHGGGGEFIFCWAGSSIGKILTTTFSCFNSNGVHGSLDSTF